MSETEGASIITLTDAGLSLRFVISPRINKSSTAFCDNSFKLIIAEICSFPFLEYNTSGSRKTFPFASEFCLSFFRYPPVYENSTGIPCTAFPLYVTTKTRFLSKLSPRLTLISSVLELISSELRIALADE